MKLLLKGRTVSKFPRAQNPESYYQYFKILWSMKQIQFYKEGVGILN